MDIFDRHVHLMLSMRTTNLPSVESVMILSRALDKFLRNERIAKLFRVCQITYDLDCPYCVVYPHVHLLLVYRDLFTKDVLIQESELCDIWQRSVGCDYRPCIHFCDVPASEDADEV